MRRTLAAALALLCAWTGIAQAHTRTGREDSTAVLAPRRVDTVFHTQRTRDITATLHWQNAEADLRLFLGRRTRSGRWVPVARDISSAHPKHLVLRTARPGRYRLRVRAASGHSRFRLVFDAGAARRPTAATPFLTLLFSRSEIMGASDCRPDRSGSVNLVTQVAPDLARRGIAATGSVETGITRAATRACVHYKRSLAASWADLARLRDRYGWKFVSHGRTFATNLASLTPKQQWSETCGSLLDLERHGHWSADGLFAYPDNKWSAEVETNVVSKCFAFGRRYARGPTTRRRGDDISPLATNHRDRRRPLQRPGSAVLEAEDRDDLPLAGHADPHAAPIGAERVADTAELRVRDRRPQGAMALQGASLAGPLDGRCGAVLLE